MRLAKRLALAGVASRRACEQIVRAGRVRVAGTVVTDPAFDVEEGAEVLLDGRRLPSAPEPVVYALHKPRGVLSTAHDTHGRPTVVALVPARGRRLYPVGRLDADSSGLILLTDDGALAHRLTHPSFGVPKTYVARVARAPIGAEALRRLRAGVELDDGRSAPAAVRRLAADTLELVLREGRKRQVRRMCAAVGHPVIELRRVAIGPLSLGDLPVGAHRRLSAGEVARLRRAGRPAGAAAARARVVRGSSPDTRGVRAAGSAGRPR
jgi:23S rRNA pseudouridine2605 synthase